MTSWPDSVPSGHTFPDHFLIDNYCGKFCIFLSNSLRTLPNSILWARSLPSLTTRLNRPLYWASIEWTGTVRTNMPNLSAFMTFNPILCMVLGGTAAAAGVGVVAEITACPSTSVAYTVSPASLAVSSRGTPRLWSILPSSQNKCHLWICATNKFSSKYYFHTKINCIIPIRT